MLPNVSTRHHPSVKDLHELDKNEDASSTASLGAPGLFKSFKAETFEELDNLVQCWLSIGNKRLNTISCWHDGHFHYAMLGASLGEVVVNGKQFHYRGQAMVNKDGMMMVQCY